MSHTQSEKAKARWADPIQRALQGAKIKLLRVSPALRPSLLRAWTLHYLHGYDWKAVAKQLGVEGLTNQGVPWTTLSLMTALQDAKLLDYRAPRPPVPWDRLLAALSILSPDDQAAVLRELAA